MGPRCSLHHAIRYWLIVASLLLTPAPARAASGSDITDATAKAILAQVKQQYGLELPFFAQVLSRVPVMKASPEFLKRYGSSVGIYLRGRVYVNQRLFRPDGTINVESSSAVAALLHESWHAYYELLLPEAEKTALNEEFRSYYNPSGKYPAEEWMCFGDEAIGNYYGDLMVAYAYAVKRYLQAGTVPEGMLKVYRSSFEAKELRGYGTDDSPAPLPISAAERAAAQRLTAGAFPPPDRLIETLRARFAAPPSPAPPSPPAGAPPAQEQAAPH